MTEYQGALNNSNGAGWESSPGVPLPGSDEDFAERERRHAVNVKPLQILRGWAGIAQMQREIMRAQAADVSKFTRSHNAVMRRRAKQGWFVHRALWRSAARKAAVKCELAEQGRLI